LVGRRKGPNTRSFNAEEDAMSSPAGLQARGFSELSVNERRTGSAQFWEANRLTSRR